MAKSVKVFLRFQPEEYEELKDLAGEVPLAAFVKNRYLEAVEKRKKPTEQ